MEKFTLVRPSKDLELQAIEFKNEFFNNGETEINGVNYGIKQIIMIFGLKK